MIKQKRTQPPYMQDKAHRSLDCKLFSHKKHTAACINLRSRRLCKVNCAPFFEWAKANPESVVSTAKVLEKQILKFLKDSESEYVNILENILPRGDFICEHCAQVFQKEKALERHKLKKHKRGIR